MLLPAPGVPLSRRQQVDQRAPRAHLHQPNLALFLLHRTSQHRLVKSDHGIEVRTANHDVVNLANGYAHRMSPFFAWRQPMNWHKNQLEV
jgi:hypothetical protein